MFQSTRTRWPLQQLPICQSIGGLLHSIIEESTKMCRGSTGIKTYKAIWPSPPPSFLKSMLSITLCKKYLDGHYFESSPIYTVLRSQIQGTLAQLLHQYLWHIPDHFINMNTGPSTWFTFEAYLTYLIFKSKDNFYIQTPFLKIGMYINLLVLNAY